MSTAAAPEKKRRFRWLRFSTRTLLVLITVVAVWLGMHTERIRRQRQAVCQVLEFGGQVVFDYGEVRGGVRFFIEDLDIPFRGMRPIQEPPGPAWLRGILGDDFFANVVEVVVTINDENTNAAMQLEFVDGLPALEKLDLTAWDGDPRIAGHRTPAFVLDDEAMRRIGGLSKLRSLSIDGIGVSRTGIAQLGRLRRLDVLFISSAPPATGDEWAFLERLVNLKNLSVYLPPEANADDARSYIRNFVESRSLEPAIESSLRSMWTTPAYGTDALGNPQATGVTNHGRGDAPPGCTYESP